ncbi:hypothetical protein RB653_007154 [Dictyostelium firmibasis]|uniref:Uncharacterized protein n=1 Tax=Dictyostelium firmibasis TaxID=79012 RepID=A0AAN7YNS2_9MYCE
MKKSSNKFVSPVKPTSTNNSTSGSSSNKFVSPVKTKTPTPTTSNKSTTDTSSSSIPTIPTSTKIFKKSSSSFQTPTKTTTTTTTNSSDSNTTPIKTPTRKSGSSFQTPTKLKFQTPNDKDESSSSSISSSTPLSLSSTPTSSSTFITKSPIEIFKTIPQYILQYLDKYIENDKEKQDLKSIIQYSYENYSNNPFNYNDLINDNNTKEYIKKLLNKLVENNILKEIILNNENNKVIKVYSSIPWYKVTSYHYLEMEIKRFEKEQQQEQQQQQQQTNNINNKYNKIAPKNSTASMVATLSPSKSKSSGNHLSSLSSSSSTISTPNKKRKPPIAFNLNEIEIGNSDFDSSNNKKFKKAITNNDPNIGGKNNILSSKYELQIERELQNIVDEKKRILKSIADKKQLLNKFQSKSNSPVSEQKKTIPTSAEEKRIDGLILKWKKGCQDATTLLQEKLIETLAQSASCNSGSVSGGGVSGYYGYGNDESNYHGDGDDNENKDYGEFSEHEIQEYKEQMKLAKEPISATKLYILKQFGVDPKFVNLDEENDCFLKEDELLKKTSTSSTKTINKK